MAEVIWRQEAIASRIEILKYGKSKFGEMVARKLNERIEECTARLKVYPDIGFIEATLVGRPILYRSIMVNKRFKLVYFTATINGEECVEIVELWDTYMNPERLKTSIANRDI